VPFELATGLHKLGTGDAKSAHGCRCRCFADMPANSAGTIPDSNSVHWHLARFALLHDSVGAVGELVGIDGGVVSGVINLESSGVETSDWRPRHDERYHEA
jgi:hypothetical protein